MIFAGLGTPIDKGIGTFVSGYEAGVGTAIAALVALGLFKIWFRPDFKGALQIKGLLTGILLLLPVLVIHWGGSIVSWTAFGTGSVLLAFLSAFAPGFSEEITFRGMGVGDWITIFAAVVGAVWGLWLTRPKYYPEIMEVWNKKWSKDETAIVSEEPASAQ